MGCHLHTCTEHFVQNILYSTFCTEHFVFANGSYLVVVLMTDPCGGRSTFKHHLCIETGPCYSGGKVHSVCAHHVLLRESNWYASGSRPQRIVS